MGVLTANSIKDAELGLLARTKSFEDIEASLSIVAIDATIVRLGYPQSSYYREISKSELAEQARSTRAFLALNQQRGR